MVSEKRIILLLENKLTYSELLALQHENCENIKKEKQKKEKEQRKQYDFWGRKYFNKRREANATTRNTNNLEPVAYGMKSHRKEMAELDLEIKVWKAINKNDYTLARKLFTELEILMKLLRKGIPRKIAQRVYEDNIKQYGTLTCYLCEKEIEFGQDSIDHIKPVVLGGSNDYENLKIAHRSCNSQKHAKPLEVFLKWRKDKQLKELEL